VALSVAVQARVTQSAGIRQWVSRAFILSILVYLVVLGYLVSESVRGASKWAPYGVNMPTFIALIIASEVVISASAVWIFREDSGIWPPSVVDGWRQFRHGSLRGLGRALLGVWDVSIVDLRLRTKTAIALGRANRLAALAPLAYALVASSGAGTPWGLRTSALVDIGLTLLVWMFMEAVMVRPNSEAVADGYAAIAPPATARSVARKESRYTIRRLSNEDIPRVEEIERIRWREQAATNEIIRARINRYPQGQLAAIHESVVGGLVASRTLVAWCTVMPARDKDVRAFRSWDEVTTHGTIDNCEPGGDVLVGVNLTSVTEGATYLLLGEVLASVVGWGKDKMIGGARLNGFVSLNERRLREGKPELAADQYARLREIRGHHLNEQRLDSGDLPLADEEYISLINNLRALNGEGLLDVDERPDYVCSNLRGYLSIPGARMVAVAPNYFPDVASDNWGVVIDWTNPLPRPLRHVPIMRGLVAQRIRNEVLAEWDTRKKRLHEKARRRTMQQSLPAAPEPVLVS
jgi:hypothetical protein